MMLKLLFGIQLSNTLLVKPGTHYVLSSIDDDSRYILVQLTAERHLTLFPASPIMRAPHHRETPTRNETNLRHS